MILFILNVSLLKNDDRIMTRITATTLEQLIFDHKSKLAQSSLTLGLPDHFRTMSSDQSSPNNSGPPEQNSSNQQDQANNVLSLSDLLESRDCEVPLREVALAEAGEGFLRFGDPSSG